MQPLLEAIGEYEPMPKIKRLNREIIVTEKIDGTNAAVFVSDTGLIWAASKTRWITPETDNYGFAAWVRDNADDLRKLGPGLHRGEWFGKGINRNYGMTLRMFALFNVSRWHDERLLVGRHGLKLLNYDTKQCPNSCTVVPVMGQSQTFNYPLIENCVSNLRYNGSVLVPGFKNPEGVVVFHTALGQPLKVTLENDEKPKGKQENE